MKKSYIKIKRKMTPSGCWDNGLYYVSDEKVYIPLGKLQQAIEEDFDAKGVGGVKKITIDGNSWIVK